MIDSDILSPNKELLYNMVTINALQCFPNIPRLSVIDFSIPEPPNTYKKVLRKIPNDSIQFNLRLRLN
jgi:hypothetical protein